MQSPPARRGSDQRQHLVPSVRPSRRAAEVKVTTSSRRPRCRARVAAGGRPALATRRSSDTVGIVLWRHLLGAPCFRAGFCSKTIIPAEEHPIAFFKGSPRPSFGGFGLRASASFAWRPVIEEICDDSWKSLGISEAMRTEPSASNPTGSTRCWRAKSSGMSPTASGSTVVLRRSTTGIRSWKLRTVTRVRLRRESAAYPAGRPTFLRTLRGPPPAAQPSGSRPLSGRWRPAPQSSSPLCLGSCRLSDVPRHDAPSSGLSAPGAGTGIRVSITLRTQPKLNT